MESLVKDVLGLVSIAVQSNQRIKKLSVSQILNCIYSNPITAVYIKRPMKVQDTVKTGITTQKGTGNYHIPCIINAFIREA